MKTVWEFTPDTEAFRIINCAHHIATDFYRNNNFFLLPCGSGLKNPIAVYFPELDYYQVPRFWKKVANVNHKALPKKVNGNFLEKVKKLASNANFPRPSFTKTKKVWSQAENEILRTIEGIIPNSKQAFGKIVIHPTIFGTSSSFNIPKSFPATFYMYLREDQDIYTITEALLTSLTRNSLFTHFGANWNESELLVDWLIAKTKIGEVLKKYQPKTSWLPTVKKIRTKQHGKLAMQSERFYKKLGLSTSSKIFSLNGKLPEIHGKPVKYLTKKESEILAKLIEKAGEVLTYEEIAEIMFVNENDYSLYAISKTIQRLRNKLERNKISGNFIQTRRGRGHCLKTTLI